MIQAKILLSKLKVIHQAGKNYIIFGLLSLNIKSEQWQKQAIYPNMYVSNGRYLLKK